MLLKITVRLNYQGPPEAHDAGNQNIELLSGQYQVSSFVAHERIRRRNAKQMRICDIERQADIKRVLPLQVI